MYICIVCVYIYAYILLYCSIMYPMALEFSSSLTDIKERAQLKELQVLKTFYKCSIHRRPNKHSSS